MRWFLAVIGLLLSAFAVAVVIAPASLVPYAIAEMEKQGAIKQGVPSIALAETSGTVWNGKALQAILTVDGVDVPLGVLEWQLKPMSLLASEPEIIFTTDAPGQILKATVTANAQGHIKVSAMEGRLPISVLEPWFPLLVRGDIAFVVDHIYFSANTLNSIDGMLNFEYVDWMGGDYDMPLGSYTAQIYNEDRKVFVKVDDFSSRLGINGLMTVNPDGLYTFKATLQPRSSLAPEVAESVAWLGKKQTNGDVFIKTRGRL